MEIERKFLIKELSFSLSEFECAEIVQSYLTEDGISPERRIRSFAVKGNTKYFLTEKSGAGMVRREDEREISRDDYEKFRASVIGEDIIKTRYFIPLDGDLTVELDVYGEKLSGLCVAEVEFRSVDDALSFIAPNWFGDEITEDKRYKNRSLSKNGLPEN